MSLPLDHVDNVESTEADSNSNKIMEWNQDLADQVSFIGIDTKQKSNTVPSATAASTGPFHLTYDKETSILKLIHTNTDTDDKQVIDRIHVHDIIGAKIEFCLGFEMERENEDDDRSKKGKAQRATERVEATEQTIRRQLLDGDTCDKCHSNDDVTGTAMESLSSSVAYLIIYAYPKAIPKHGIFRQLKDYLFPSRSQSSNNDHGDDDRSEKEEEAQWGPRYAHHRRYKLANLEDFKQARELLQNVHHISGLQSAHTPTAKKYLVVVNPMSGTKKGRQIYESTVKNMLMESNVDHEVLVTDHAGHARERMNINQHIKKDNDKDKEEDQHKDSQEDISKYNGVIMVGGDGTLAEIMQGLKERSDYNELLEEKLTFGVVGGGTMNGLVSSLLYAKKEKFNPLESMFLICRGRSSKMDLSFYETESKTYTAFLTFSWALVADSDIESECIRFMGPLRTDIWAVWRMIFLRKYRATFSYLPPENIHEIGEHNKIPTEEQTMKHFPKWKEDIPSNWKTIEGDFVVFWPSQVSHPGAPLLSSPHSRIDDGVFQVLIMRQPVSRLDLVNVFLSLENGGHVNHPKVEFIKCVAFRLDPADPKMSINDLDGEVVQAGKIQARVIPGKMNIFA
uniref:DAGKc domain-containing protein n=1 Tax=Corethron hystrix TaxID=216773 RepID=A0A7S1FT61_9STRA|mmetsp:Transcript_26941/g.62008  ORF Transcript_26941/g.62008 Transcript_26941/m.62008 type:complete len:623 (+) Transcript_26941:267-2135(+)